MSTGDSASSICAVRSGHGVAGATAGHALKSKALERARSKLARVLWSFALVSLFLVSGFRVSGFGVSGFGVAKETCERTAEAPLVLGSSKAGLALPDP
eukprot:1562993-Rhodomonas_salina.1